eukprot:m.274853 g.274853  ORF g.274853 m.274853 type:complete len:348 (+) comp19762_c0_seq29:412-1455(+)
MTNSLGSQASKYTGAASFSPRVIPRPDYTIFRWGVLRRAYVLHMWYPLMFTVVATVLKPMYYQLAKGLFCRGWFDVLHTTFPLPAYVTHEDMIFAVGMTLSLTAVWLPNQLFYFILDHFSFLQRYKLHRSAAQNPSTSLYTAALLRQIGTHYVSAPMISFFLAGPLLRRMNTRAAQVDAIPHPLTLWKNFWVMYALNDILFYLGHRCLHSKQFYAPIHKMHHSFIGTKAIAAEHSTTTEAVLTAYIPFVAGAVLCGCHYYQVCIWFFCRLWQVYEDHSGYCFYGSVLHKLCVSHPVQAAMHDHHHTTNRGNFGAEILDYAFGTMDAWVEQGCVHGYLARATTTGKRE